MKISIANFDDLEEILEVQHLAFTTEAIELNNFDIEPLTQDLNRIKEEFNEGLIFKGVINHKIIASIRSKIENNTCYIHKLFVHPDYRGNGYANNILNYFEDYILNLYPNIKFELYTSAISVRNLNFYKNHGFIKFKEEIIDDILFAFFKKY